jgi:hypothetical protein
MSNSTLGDLTERSGEVPQAPLPTPSVVAGVVYRLGRYEYRAIRQHRDCGYWECTLTNAWPFNIEVLSDRQLLTGRMWS